MSLLRVIYSCNYIVALPYFPRSTGDIIMRVKHCICMRVVTRAVCEYSGGFAKEVEENGAKKKGNKSHRYICYVVMWGDMVTCVL